MGGGRDDKKGAGARPATKRPERVDQDVEMPSSQIRELSAELIVDGVVVWVQAVLCGRSGVVESSR